MQELTLEKFFFRVPFFWFRKTGAQRPFTLERRQAIDCEKQ
jgi:hypothetical protein